MTLALDRKEMDMDREEMDMDMDKDEAVVMTIRSCNGYGPFRRPPPTTAAGGLGGPGGPGGPGDWETRRLGD